MTLWASLAVVFGVSGIVLVADGHLAGIALLVLAPVGAYRSAFLFRFGSAADRDSIWW